MEDLYEKRLSIALQALQTIREHYGQVCEEYEICRHDACFGSYGAWATADEALGEIDKLDSN